VWSLPVTYNKDVGHTIRSAIAENPNAAHKLHGYKNRSYCRSKFYIARIGNFVNFALFALVILILTLWPLYTNLIRIPSRCIRRAKWTFYVKAFKSYRSTYIQTERQTDMQTDVTETITTPLRKWWQGVVELPAWLLCSEYFCSLYAYTV